MTARNAAKGQKYASPVHAEADRQLSEIGLHRGILARLEAEALAQMEDLEREWASRLRPHREQMAFLEGALIKLAKTLFFGALSSCKMNLPHGALLYGLSHPVIRRKGVTPERLEELGYTEAVKIVKSVDWDRLETWPEARLLLVGTERKAKEVFAYELKEA